MSNFEATKQHVRKALLFCLNFKKVLLKVIAKRQKAWVLPCEPSPSMPKCNIHAQEVMQEVSKIFGEIKQVPCQKSQVLKWDPYGTHMGSGLNLPSAERKMITI